MFRQHSNGLQTVRTIALSHAEKARTPLKPSPPESGKDRKHLERERRREDKRKEDGGLICFLDVWIS